MGASLFSSDKMAPAKYSPVHPRPGDDKPPEETPTLWASVFVVAYSSFLVGVALAQLNALTGDASAKGSLSLTTTEVSVCTAALYGAAGLSSICATYALDGMGRRATLLRLNACFVVGGACALRRGNNHRKPRGLSTPAEDPCLHSFRSTPAEEAPPRHVLQRVRGHRLRPLPHRPGLRRGTALRFRRGCARPGAWTAATSHLSFLPGVVEGVREEKEKDAFQEEERAGESFLQPS